MLCWNQSGIRSRTNSNDSKTTVNLSERSLNSDDYLNTLIAIYQWFVKFLDSIRRLCQRKRFF
jgi:hypothetical protein